MSANHKIILKVGLLIAAVFALTSCAPAHCSADWLILSINNANGNGPGTDTIDLAPSCTYELEVVDNTVDGNNGLPSIISSIIINGNGATIRRSTLSQKAAIRLFHISQGGELTLNDITLYDGMGIEPVNVADNIRNSGGAVFNNGVLTVNNSTLDYNRAKLKGGGIYNAGTMTVNATTFKNNGVNIGNEPGESGGAIYNAGTGNATISKSTFSGNIASQSAAGIANVGMMTITNSTFSGNSTTLTGIVSGAAISNAGSLHMSYSTVTSNVGTTSGAVFSAPDTIEISNSIVANNLPADCSYPAISWISGPNLDSDGSCDGFTITDDPQLGPLANNGGPTQTHAIAPSSPAKNAAAGSCPATDQRGEPRPHGSACDLGAYEFSGGGSQSDPAELSGYVFDDLNADGVMDPGEPPLAGVQLVLGDGTCAIAGISQTTLSLSDGSYQFNLLSPNAGTYCISIDPLTPPNDTLLIPGGFTLPPAGEYEITLTEGQDLNNLLFGWDYQFAGTDIQPNPVIIDVVLSTTSPLDGDFVGVEVTVENQGDYPASGYELVLIPHYGWGPPNPAGYVVLPDLMPNVPHTEVFSPGVYYSPAGTYTLRVLLTDDWYALGDPDSTGTNGDYQDFAITVTEGLSFCNPFYKLDPSLVLLNIQKENMLLPVYLKTAGVPIPGQNPGEEPQPGDYYATLGEIQSNLCGLQGFEDRLYCTFNLTKGMPGAVVEYKLFRVGCPDPIHTQPKILLPELPVSKQCKSDLGKEDCEAAGGTMSTGVTRAPYCVCP